MLPPGGVWCRYSPARVGRELSPVDMADHLEQVSDEMVMRRQALKNL